MTDINDLHMQGRLPDSIDDIGDLEEAFRGIATIEPMNEIARRRMEEKGRPVDNAPRNPEPLQRGDHAEVAGRLVDLLRRDAPCVHVDGCFYRYSHERGIFEPIDRAVLSRSVQGFAGAPVNNGKTPKGTPKFKPLRVNAGDVSGTTKLAADIATEPEFFEAAPRGVAFSGTFVEVTAEGIAQHEHSPKHRARYAYPFGFAREAEPAGLLEFFGQVWRDDADREQKIALVQEYLGVSLLGLATRYQKAIVLVGDGANGKGVLGSIIERCMPPGSVVSIAPQDMAGEYRRAMLAGKLLNIVSELPEGDILDSESWKAIVAGDTTTGREIRGAPFTFKPAAGHIYSANRLPGTSDQSHGFWRRLIVLGFGRVFQPHEQNPGLADHIVETEARAVVSWALQGAQRVLASGGYTMPDSSGKALEGWQRAADQVRAFVDDWTTRLPLDAAPSSGTKAEALYRAFRSWAVENGHRPMASNKFGERMRLLGLPSHKTMNGNTYPVILDREESPAW